LFAGISWQNDRLQAEADFSDDSLFVFSERAAETTSDPQRPCRTRRSAGWRSLQTKARFPSVAARGLPLRLRNQGPGLPRGSQDLQRCAGYCGLGYPADFPAAVDNDIALIQRGTLTFAAKAANAKAAGARAAIIFNKVPGNFNGMLQSSGDWIPTVSLSQADGQMLQAALPTAGTMVNVPDPALIYRLTTALPWLPPTCPALSPLMP